MKPHTNKDRLFISIAIVESPLNISPTLRNTAIDCVLAYEGEPLNILHLKTSTT